jgi:hypothetical protein
MDARCANAVFAVVVAACGSAATTGTTPPSNGANGPAPGYAATQWVPATPAYVFAAPTLRDAQHALVGAFDGLTLPFGASSDDVGHALADILGVEALHEDATTAIGVDAAGGFALFAENPLAPTIAVHLTSPELFAQFIDRQRHRGMVSQSVVVDGVEVFTAQLGRDGQVSWAVVTKPDTWLLVHFLLDGPGEPGTGWFQHARAGGSAWRPAWDAAAHRAGRAAMIGFADLRGVLQGLAQREKDMVACAHLFDAVSQVSFAFDASGAHASTRLAFELGPAAQTLRGHLLPPPSGWAGAASGAAVAVQWNLDLQTAVDWVLPCARTFGNANDVAALPSAGIRAGRVAVRAFDADDPSHDAGAAVLDLADSHFLAKFLDEIPMRKHLESDRTFGGVAGHTVAIPMVARFDYVLNDHLAALGMGDGQLDRVFSTGGAAGDPPLFALDITPPTLPPATWATLIKYALQVGAESAKDVAERLSHWRHAHVAIAIDGSALAVEASGDRR